MRWRTVLFVFSPAFLLFVLFLIYFSPETAAFLYTTILFLSPIWLPALLAYSAWPLWFRFARMRYVAGIPYTLVELKPGAETPQTAKPMELVFYSLYHRTDLTKKDFLFGHVRLPWSFEVYAHGGVVRFFVYLPVDHLSAFESRFRAEYHDIEVYEVRDYSREIPFNSSLMRSAFREYTLSKPDPYPIKTYPAYETDAHRDVFAEMLEELSSMGPGEHILLSYLIRPHQRERKNYFEDPYDTLHEDAYHVIAEIVGIKGEVHALPAAKQALVAAIEGALKKPSFDCGIRILYLAEKNHFDMSREQKLDGFFSRFSDDDLNGFVSYDPTERAGFFAKEIFATLPHFKTSHAMNLYRRRAFFAPPYIGECFVLNTEELATVFHLPQPGHGGVVGSGQRAKLEPPENLPV